MNIYGHGDSVGVNAAETGGRLRWRQMIHCAPPPSPLPPPPRSDYSESDVKLAVKVLNGM